MKNYLLSTALICAALSSLFLNGCKKDDDNSISMNTVNKGIEIVLGPDSITQYEVVNLGLPSKTLWAKCNIGATSPEMTGHFFAWGETQTKDTFTDKNYKWCVEGSISKINKYTVNEPCYVIDNKKVLELADDAANAIMGEGWKIPTENQFRELLNSRYCTAKWCKLNGVGGYLFTSVRKGYEGNSVFFPMSGMKDIDKIRFAKDYGYYWCNSLSTSSTVVEGEIIVSVSTIEANVLWLEHLDVDNHLVLSRTRYLGLPIRPVYTAQ